ncbi:hypothetical protein RCC30_14420 [Pseudomonas fluorescens]|nr:hypothetical protein RCC30_14420 [Pseudomonas fluorescens]
MAISKCFVCWRVLLHPLESLLRSGEISYHSKNAHLGVSKKFHPADAFFEFVETASGFEVDYSSLPKYPRLKNALPDHHINFYFFDIVGNGNFEVVPVGHARRAINNELGSLTGEIVELFIANLDYIELLDWVVPPQPNRSFSI